ncbi:MAG: AAA family ATPase [Clostridiales bacterium]|nr:AAA family ATPase [Candidatus Blautia equi]
MGQYLNPGNDGFASMIKGKYVDKTGLIHYINKTLGTTEKLTCVSRPRRFGKSYATKMLCAYYDISCDSRKLFEGMAISECEDFEKHLNRYHVIYLDMTSFIKERSRQSEDMIDRMQEAVIRELRDAFPEVEVKQDLPDALAVIAEKTGNKFVFIIDEWDMVFREMTDKELQDKYILLLRRLFKNSGYTDKMIEAAYITGILPIKKYGTQSAMTDFLEYTMLRPGPLKEYVGFTEQETRDLFAASPLEFEEAKAWYDGYLFGTDTHIYSPKSVIDALRFEEFGNYWTQSETYESLKLYIDMNFDGLKEAIMDLLANQPYTINPITFQNDMTTICNKDDVLTLLVHLGYLSYNSRNRMVTIPNEEVRSEFITAVENGNKRELIQLIKATRV